MWSLYLLLVLVTSRSVVAGTLQPAPGTDPAPKAYALTRYAMEQRKHEAAMEMELKSAREVQQVLIPEALPDVAGW